MEALEARQPHTPGEVAEGVLTTTDFVECYETHYRRLVRALRLAGADASTAEDVAQEAFARALVRWRRVSKGTNPPGYVYTTAFRLLQRALRKPPPPTAPEPPASPIDSHVTTTVALERALAAMPPKRRACAVMCLVVGLSPHEAAEVLHVADGTVRKHLEDARRDLRAGLGLGG